MTMIEAVTAGVLSRLRSGLAVSGAPDEAELVSMVGAAAVDAGRVLGAADVLAVTARVRAELWGLGPLQPLVEQSGVTDVLVNGPGEVWVDRGLGLNRVRCALGGEEQVRALAVRLAAASGRRLDEAAPWVDARLDHGIRLHAVIPPVSPAGTLISLRILRREPFDLAEMVTAGCLPPSWADVLTALVTDRAAFLISGGTGAGKTTLLATLLSLVPPTERVVLVEDVGELWPQHPHVVRLEARHANVEGRGSVSLADLVRQALRMRPDRLVVGECRGAEVRDLLTALNTGHAGGCGTVHANTTADVPARLEALGALAGLSPSAVRVQAVAALDAIVHVERIGARRRVVEIAAVQRSTSGGLSLLPALTAGPQPADPGTVGPGWPGLSRRLRLPQERS
ncbi:MAG TPA: TadA family conjugal transfer-associated ATPase [Kineosporiaceae bacterium]|nr:TadA family conjugal transfer-associated ATPase [Kineosporiaceae bacterium]